MEPLEAVYYAMSRLTDTVAPEKLVLINLGKTFLPEGTVPQLEHQAGIDAAGIARAVQEART